MAFKELFESKEINFYKFTYPQTERGITNNVTTYVAISKGDEKEVEKFFKKSFSRVFKGFKDFKPSTKKEFMKADDLQCYVNTYAIGRGFSPLWKEEGLEKISKR